MRPVLITVPKLGALAPIRVVNVIFAGGDGNRGVQTAAFNLPNLITIVSTVATLMAIGALVGRWLNMYPIESAIINACHSGQGGTGDVAILTAANRMQLMPFAQIATRIGGAITVTAVLILLSRLV